MPKRIRLLSILLLTSIALAACGDDVAKPATSGNAKPADAGSFPAVIGTVTIPSKPQRIVSLSPTATEILFAIGAGSQVAAVDDQSNFPTTAPKSSLSGLSPNVEAIAKYNPDLVIMQFDSGGIAPKLNALKIPVLMQPSANKLADSYLQIEQLGTATGRASEATKTIDTMKAKIAELAGKAKKSTPPLRYYHEVDNTLYSATSKTFIGELYTLAGLTNIADAADKQGSGYPQLTAEYLVSQDPDLIFLADTKCCQQNAKTVAARNGFDKLKAVRTNKVIELDDDIASRWGPRVVDLLTVIVDATNK